MKYELQGVNRSDGKPRHVQVVAPSPAAAVHRARVLAGRKGVDIIPWAAVKELPSAEPDAHPVANAAPPRPAKRRPAIAKLTAGALAMVLVTSLLLALRAGSADTVAAGSLAATVPATPRKASAAAAPPPEHTSRGIDGELMPEAGYAWVGAGKSRVAWSPGKRHDTFPHIVSAQQEGFWTADAGYVFPKPDDLAVAWQAGRGHPQYPNIVSSNSEGSWLAQPGYEFVSKGLLTVRWAAGRDHPTAPHVVSGGEPGKWGTRPGYVWVDPKDAGSFAVRWMAGLPLPGSPNVVSGETEGQWSPAEGYAWANSTPGEFSVIKRGPSQEQVQAGVTKVVLALVANAGTRNQDTDTFGQMFAREALRAIRDRAIRSALSDLFPHERSTALDQAANIIVLAADGRLTADNWTAANTRDAIVNRIRSHDPSAADAVELADFIGRVVETYQRSQ